MRAFLILLCLPLNAAYLYSRTATVAHAQVPSDQTGFTLTISITDATLKSAANGGHVQNTVTQSGGKSITIPADLIFTSDSGGTTKIPWDFDIYDAVNGIILAHVKTNISSTVDTVFYMKYGDVTVTTQQNTSTVSPANTWDSSHQGVWHFGTSTVTNAVDSTSNANNGTLTNSPTASTGLVGGAFNFLAVSAQYVNLGAGASINVAGPCTIELWAKTTNLTNIYRRVISNLTGSAYNGYEIVLGSSADSGSPSVADRFYFQVGASNVIKDAISNSAITAGTWYYVAATYDGTTGIIYINGVAQTSTFTASSAIGSSSQNVNIARWPGTPATNYWNGDVDEVRIANAARSANWITVRYNDQKSGANLIAIGSETTTATSGTRRRVVSQ